MSGVHRLYSTSLLVIDTRMDQSIKSNRLDYIALHVIVMIIVAIFILSVKKNEHPRRPPSIMRDIERSAYMREIFHGNNTKKMLRMNPNLFFFLARIMRERYLLRDTVYVSIEEQLAMFLQVVGHNTKNSVISVSFRRSGETVSRYVNEVLHAIGAIREMFMEQPNGDVPIEIQGNPAWYPWFKDCIGLIDGTIIPAKVPLSIAARFIGRKGGTTQNILAAARPNKLFTYVLAGWEGSANDYTVLKDALNIPAPHGLKVIEGRYYLVDAGYTTMPGFIAPYRSTQYYLRELEGRTPTNRKELFNLRHSSLRINIEGAFGILKSRFKILTESPFYPYKTQVDKALACFILHNFIMEVDPHDRWANKRIVYEEEEEEEDHTQLFQGHESYRAKMPQRIQRQLNKQWVKKRDDMAWDMWKEYCDRERNGDYTES